MIKAAENKIKKLLTKIRREFVFTEKDAFDLSVVLVNYFRDKINEYLEIKDRNIPILISEEVEEECFAKYKFNIVVYINNYYISSSSANTWSWISRTSDRILTIKSLNTVPYTNSTMYTKFIKDKSIIIYVKNIFKFSFGSKYEFAKEVVEALAHELYHVHQQEKDMSAFDNYIKFEKDKDNFHEYESQEVEMEARNFSRKYVSVNENRIYYVVDNLWKQAYSNS